MLLQRLLAFPESKSRFSFKLTSLSWKSYHYTSYGGIYGGKRPKLKSDVQVSASVDRNRAEHSNLMRVINSFREHGHRGSHINPLIPSVSCDERLKDVPELNLDRFSLNKSQNFNPEGLLYGQEFQFAREAKVSDGIKFLTDVYAKNTGYEFMYIEDEAEREWFAREIESRSSDQVSTEQKLQIALEMIKSQNFDHYLGHKFPTLKRYGGEGCESVIAFYMELFQSCARQNVEHVVIGMAHRGRLNFLAGPLNFPSVRIFQKIKGFPEFPPDVPASGDVLSHLGTSVNLEANGKNVHVSLLPNPSHLEAVNPMAVGKVRARQQTLKLYDYSADGENDTARVMCLQIHGDAAISGQGINQETLGFANVPNFRIGGSVHLVINNQIGFTTPQELGRSSRYTTDIAKSVGAPVIHVNGACPEDVVRAARLAVDYRQTFEKDIFVDVICFRLHGHNELDDPTFTNPELYKLIRARKSIPDEYCETLKEENILSDDVVKKCLEEHNRVLNENMSLVDEYTPMPFYRNLQEQWGHIIQPGHVKTVWETGTEIDLLKYVGAKSVEYPEDFAIHPHLKKLYVKHRLEKINAGTNIDWGTAEALAFGSLLYQGFEVRLSGEDIGRGTFSHRHVMLVDQNNGDIFVPLNSLLPKQNKFLEVANSTLSEEAVLAFEYGYSIDNPNNLVIWEAQFGDFFNGAQIPIDTLITSGETKWTIQSGLVMLLPHGMDGAGPEHSSCRIERFLQLTDSSDAIQTDGDFNNFQVVNPTTPAQYFHLLRRQVIRNFRKPLVVVAPKILLRLSAATSSLTEMGPNTHFKPVLGDDSPVVKAKDVKKLIFVSGKHYYTLKEKRDELKDARTAIIRVESLCPFPVNEIEEEISKYPNATKLIWSQEEHRNQGAWTFVQPRFQNLLGKQIEYVGRKTLAAPAVGVSQWHQKEVADILKKTFEIA